MADKISSGRKLLSSGKMADRISSGGKWLSTTKRMAECNNEKMTEFSKMTEHYNKNG
jgi:hypothetical protein